MVKFKVPFQIQKGSLAPSTVISRGTIKSDIFNDFVTNFKEDTYLHDY